MSLPVIIVGAGGHGRVVADALAASGRNILGFLDKAGRPQVGGLPVLGDDDALEAFDPEQLELANGIGGGGQRNALTVREEAQRRLEAKGWAFTSVRHPASIVANSACVATGSHIMAGAIIQANAWIEVGAIINTAAVIEHDSHVAAFAHVSSGAVLCGNVEIGNRTHVGAAAVVRQGVCIGPDIIIGAGAAVVSNFGEGELLLGVPARSRSIGR